MNDPTTPDYDPTPIKPSLLEFLATKLAEYEALWIANTPPAAPPK